MRLKPLSELMLAAALLLRLGAGEAEFVAGRCWEATDRGDDLFRLLVARPAFLDLASVCDTFQWFGLENPRLRRRVVALAELRAGLDLEGPPWRRVALQYHLHHTEPGRWDPPDLPPDAWVRHLPEPWTVADQTAYATTHHVFYATDFGQTPERLPGQISEWL